MEDVPPETRFSTARSKFTVEKIDDGPQTSYHLLHIPLPVENDNKSIQVSLLNVWEIHKYLYNF